MPGKNVPTKVICQEGSETDVPTFYLVVDDVNAVVESDGEVVLDFTSAGGAHEEDDVDPIGESPSDASNDSPPVVEPQCSPPCRILKEKDPPSSPPTEETPMASEDDAKKGSAAPIADDRLMKHELDYFGEYVSSALKSLPPSNAYVALASIVRILSREKRLALSRKRKTMD